MFRKSKEKAIIAEADRLGMKKEELDTLSWERIVEIGRCLQNGVGPEEVREFGRELLAIAHANTSLLEKFGLSEDSFSGRVLPSGIEVLENDQERVNHYTANGSPGENDPSMEGAHLSGEDEKRYHSGSFPAVGVDQTIGLDQQVAEDLQIEIDLQGEAGLPVDEVLVDQVEQLNGKSTDEIELTPQIVLDVVKRNNLDIDPVVLEALIYEIAQESEAESETQTQSHWAVQVSAESGLTPEATNNASNSRSPEPQTPLPEDTKEANINHEPPPQVSTPKATKDASNSSSPGPQVPADKAPGSTREDPSPLPQVGPTRQELANFTLVYSSRDGALSLYRDGEGHVVAVDNSKLC